MMKKLFRGRLERWNDGKGFGFIRPEQGQKDIFIHISAFQKSKRRPLVGDLIDYRTNTDQQGRIMAVNAQIVGDHLAVIRNERESRNSIGLGPWAWIVGILLTLSIAGAYFFFNRYGQNDARPATVDNPFGNRRTQDSDTILQKAFDARASNLQVEGGGNVVSLLPDDTDGRRHQKFIIRLNSGQTLMMAHNIELSSRIDDIKEGDAIEFFGEYEWNEKGGVIHWTHHDPERRHRAGWLKHNGRLYQ